MKIELTIEAGQLGNTVLELFETLTEAQKREIAQQVVTNYFLDDNNQVEREAFSDKVIAELKASGETHYGTKLSVMPDSEIKMSYKYKTAMEKFESLKSQVINAVRSEVSKHFLMEITEQIKKDPQIEVAKTEIMNTVKASMPKIAAESLVNLFTQTIVGNIWNLTAETQNLKNMLTTLDQKIQEVAVQHAGGTF